MNKTIHLLLLYLLLFCSGVVADNTSILIIKSSDNRFFNQTVERLINQTQSQVKFKIKTLDSVKKDESLLTQSNVIITLGLTAAKYSVKAVTRNTPVIHSYITEFQFNRSKHNPLHKYHYSILLDQPLHRYLNFIKQLVEFDKIGIIRNQQNKISRKTLDHYESTLGIKLTQELFETGNNPLNKIKDLLQLNDVLLSLPNPQVYNRQTLKGILLTSYRQKKPVISYSLAHVKSGALAAIFSSPENIGNQIAELVSKLLGDKKFKPENFYYASEFDIKINHRVAKSLGIKLADKEQILKALKSDAEK